MINSTEWWPVGSRPPKGVVHSSPAVLRSGADLLDDPRPEQKPGKALQGARISNDHAPASAKFIDTCNKLPSISFHMILGNKSYDFGYEFT
eukprot:3188986-Karenia_brevis.AAC.1